MGHRMAARAFSQFNSSELPHLLKHVQRRPPTSHAYSGRRPLPPHSLVRRLRAESMSEHVCSTLVYMHITACIIT